ncbi:hypothetical protein [Acinetobacter ursingii]|uniref:hypothetical protein n=1 Tax=Acinetobacter ursingii TaxID=108980 RepID=UPI001957DD7C|nr:hypothetical protein [Acinetobacter ursingii]VTX78125.1 Uncharacterised protein [Acinetobacter ursingii]
MDQQIVTIVVAFIAVSGTLLAGYINSKTSYRIAYEKLKSEEKQNDIKIKIELKKLLYLEYFENLSNVHTWLIRIINEPDIRNNNQFINLFSASTNKIKLVASSNIVVKIFDIEKNYLIVYLFIMQEIIDIVKKENEYKDNVAKLDLLNADVHELKQLLQSIPNNEKLSKFELSERITNKYNSLVELIEQNLNVHTILLEFRNELMRKCLDKMQEIDSLNNDLILLMREDIGLINDNQLFDFIREKGSYEVRGRISDILNKIDLDLKVKD